MTSQAEKPARQPRSEVELAAAKRAESLLATGGILGALAASSCCMLPLALFGLGIGGAWISHLTRLAPYQPYFIAASVGCLGFGYWLRYRTRHNACAAAAACARPLPSRATAIGMIFAFVLVAGALALDLLAPLFL